MASGLEPGSTKFCMSNISTVTLLPHSLSKLLIAKSCFILVPIWASSIWLIWAGPNSFQVVDTAHWQWPRSHTKWHAPPPDSSSQCCLLSNRSLMHICWDFSALCMNSSKNEGTLIQELLLNSILFYSEADAPSRMKKIWISKVGYVVLPSISWYLVTMSLIWWYILILTKWCHSWYRNGRCGWKKVKKVKET